MTLLSFVVSLLIEVSESINAGALGEHGESRLHMTPSELTLDPKQSGQHEYHALPAPAFHQE
jgi:hypothetical protein